VTNTIAGIKATDFAFKEWDGAAPNVKVATGGSVTYSYPAGASLHNVVFTGAQPSFCRQSTVAMGAPFAPPLPAQPTGPSWLGGCTFNTPGAYPFVCGLHPTMHGSVTVGPGPDAGPPPASALRLAGVQHGFAIKGSVKVRLAGSRLWTRAFATRNGLRGRTGGTSYEHRIGSQELKHVGRGRRVFRIGLIPGARKALRRNGKLLITVKVVVSRPALDGPAYSETRKVTVRLT
jgi:plastocyanin